MTGSHPNTSCSLSPSLNMWIGCSCSLLKMESSPVIHLPLAKGQEMWAGETYASYMVAPNGTLLGRVQSLPEKDLIFLWGLLSHMASGSTVSWQYLLCVFKRMSLEFSDLVSDSWEPWTQQRTVIAHFLLALCRSWYPWGATTGAGASLVCCHVKITPLLPALTCLWHPWRATSVPPWCNKSLHGRILLAPGSKDCAPCKSPTVFFSFTEQKG